MVGTSTSHPFLRTVAAAQKSFDPALRRRFNDTTKGSFRAYNQRGVIDGRPDSRPTAPQ
jgi:hypothetical protein